MSTTKNPAPWGAIAVMLALIITAVVLNAWADRVGPSWPATSQATESATEPAKTAQSSASAQVSTLSPKYIYQPRETVTGAYITTDGQPTALTDGWATTPASEAAGTWYAYGSATDTLTIESTATVTRIVWVLPDGSQRVQEGDLTYYDPEEGNH